MMGPLRATILGAGNMGTALARQVAGSGHAVHLWDFFPEVVDEINTSRRNTRYLPGVSLPEEISATASLEEACMMADGMVILCIPSAFLEDLVPRLARLLPEAVPVLNAAKGVSRSGAELLQHLLARTLQPRPCLALAGPALATEMAAGAPTSLVVAGSDLEAVRLAESLLRGGWVTVDCTEDVVGAAVGGVLKNVYAILLGYEAARSAGAANTQAAVLTRAAAEMTALGQALGGEVRTLRGLAGLGDLLATGLSDLSNNRRFGLELGRGRRAAELEASRGFLPEGARTLPVVLHWAEHHGIDVPLARRVHDLLQS